MIDKTDIEVDIVDEDGTVLDTIDWPFCQVEDCENRISRNLSKFYCFIHSGGPQTEALIEEANKVMDSMEFISK